MEIILKGHDAENGVRQIMQLFFSLSDDVKVESWLDEKRAGAKITYRGKSATGEALCTQEGKLYVTNAIKKSVFYAAKKLSDMPTPWGISTGIRPGKTAVGMRKNGYSEEEIISHLKDEYLIEDKKATLCTRVAQRELPLLESIPENSVSIYVGIPFCPSRCSYCSFISQATEHNKKFIEPFAEALLKEIEYSAKIVKELGMKADTVYFGGGTPTAIDENILKRIIEKLRGEFDLSAVREFTVEAGRPDTFTLPMIKMLKDEGVDRISINPQTMHDKTLERIGRRHSAKDVEKAFYIAREAGFDHINADLIAALPGEDAKMMEETVSRIMEFAPEAVTVHTLYMKRAAEMIDDFERIRFADNAAEMMDVAVKMLGENNILPYYMYKQRNTLGNLENVGFAKEGCEGLYNVYIMEEVQPIIALGAAGSTKMVKGGEIERVFNPKEASDYAQRIDEVLKRKDMFYKFYKDREEK